MFSVQKFYDALRYQGTAVSKDTLHAYLGHLEDTFLIRTVSLHTASERRRMVNPRKAYPVDPGLIAPYERSGREKLDHALETVVFLELERRGYEAGYLRSPEGWEVDFMATAPDRTPLLVQVCLDMQGEGTWDREIRALVAAAEVHPRATPLLLTMDATPPPKDPPPPIAWHPAARWLLDEGVEAP